MDEIKLDSELIEDLEFDLLPIIEEKFQIKLEYSELSEIKDFDGLCSLVLSKINHENDNFCTSQLAFYKLRKVFISIGLDGDSLTPSSKLEDLYPKRYKKYFTKKIENKLGIEMEELSPNPIVFNILLAFMANFIFGAILYSFIIGLIGIAISILLFVIAFRYWKVSKYKTVRELIQGTTCENYFEYRGSRNSVNRQEFRGILMNWFSSKLGLSKEELDLAVFK